MRSVVTSIFSLTIAIAVIACKNPSSVTDVTHYSVTYNLNNGSGTAPSDSNTYRVNQEVTAASLPAGVTPPNGKVFAGWNTQADGSGTDVQAGGTIRMVSGGLTLYAKWTDRTYSVTYNLNNGSGTAPSDSNTYATGQEVTAASLPAGVTPPNGKVFAGWNTQADGSGTDVQAGGTIRMVSGGLILYAKWTDRTYSVTYNLNGGRGTAPRDSNTYATGQEVTAASLPAGVTPPTGKVFAGWNTTSDGSGTDVAAGGTIRMVSGGLTLYAKWTDRTYSVTYNLNGGRGTAPRDSNTYIAGQRLTVKPSTGMRAPTGKGFVGWNTRANGRGTTIQPGASIPMPRGGLTLYAKWATTYSVTYNLNGGRGTAPSDSNTYATGQEVTAASLPAGVTPPTGKRFVGWNTRANGRGITVQAGRTIRMVRGGLILYAKWATTYSVTYNLNGGRGTAPRDSNTYTAGQRLTVKPSTGMRAPSGKRFVGWNTRANGRGITVQAGRTIRMVRGGLILYAKWN